MMRFFTTLILSFIPALVLADESGLSLAPPSTDYSVVFLGNLFGIVDGVLHGTGSQIMGAMFGVFNSAVLALGGIIIMYTLMVSTMNTAHEGQMLGQKWSSIWIPVRSTMGLALLIPKASGYCLMQIFVMWVVVQGIGAADKIWGAALGYLNRGGVIIQAQADPTVPLTTDANSGVSGGALAILSGQVCMLGLQKQLTATRQSYLNAQSNSAGPCYQVNPQSPMGTFCNTAVPDFIGTVNAVVVQRDTDSSIKSLKAAPASSYSVSMPNFASSSPYAQLNGFCGSISWNALPEVIEYERKIKQTKKGTSTEIKSHTLAYGFDSADLETARISRAIAIQQMYLDLSSVAQVMVNNNPIMNPSTSGNTAANFSSAARQQFGVPYMANGGMCKSQQDGCVTWGSVNNTGSNSGILFNGTEFQGAIADYNGIMMPTVRMLQAIANNENTKNSRAFIEKSLQEGWMMAGSYFFDLVRLNGNAVTGANDADSNTGLDKSSFSVLSLSSPCTADSGKYNVLCVWMDQNLTPISQIQTLIDGTNLQGPSVSTVTTNQSAIPTPDLNPQSTHKTVGGIQSSTVYGFINNAYMMKLPGQPGTKPLEFANLINFSVDNQLIYLTEMNFDCGRVKIILFSFCLGRLIGNTIYNKIFVHVYNFFLSIFAQIINQVVNAFLMIPLQGMSAIFKTGLKTISEPGVNPIQALANMGAMYINFASHLWLMLLNMSIASSVLMPFGIFIFALIALAMPLLAAWFGIMIAVGFTTAYYVPILPYLIFTLGTIGWLIAVIEAMVAAPIVALGVTHPEGHDAFGKGEAAIMILMNVFLRPSMMIIGYITAIALSYVGVWVLNAGFDHAIGFIQGGVDHDTGGGFLGFKGDISKGGGMQNWNSFADNDGGGSGSGGYKGWAGIYAYFFSILMYTTIYLIIVQKSFTLISYLPDKVLRWIGGSPESIGEQTAGWGEEAKQKVGEAGKSTSDAQGQVDKKLGAYGQKATDAAGGAAKKAAGGDSNVSSTPGGGDGDGGGSGPRGGGAPGGAGPEAAVEAGAA